MRCPTWLNTVAATVAITASACGGGTLVGGSDAGRDGGPPCSASQPMMNGACAPSGTQCEYGYSPSPHCNETFDCLDGGWVGSGSGGGGYCAPSDCPSGFSDVPQGMTCVQTGLGCAYPEGQCDCSNTGVAGVSVNATWQCFEPQGCPEPRPFLGTPCTHDGLACDYGGCSGGMNETCKGGYWQPTPTPCPQ
jgi:hypothetical protein